MNDEELKETIYTIEKMKEKGIFNNYIEYIDFPYYKNLVPKTRINFKFPMTVLIGKNGSGKSSTLHALFGAPHGYTCSDFWFSTELDPIAESGERNRYFYGYKENNKSEIKEVIKTRMKRGSETKKEKFDYWETSRPVAKDGMISRERVSPVEKEVIYLNFKVELSAFDKIFYFSKADLEERKNILRTRSKYLKRLFNEEPMKFRGTQDNKMGKMEILSKDIVKKIGNILNKEYDSIKVAEHKLYKISGVSVYIKTKFANDYSEANAGSGEIAIVQLVRRIENASEYSLILLDEPEISIHPGAQENLKIYLLEAIKRKKLQIIISSHSPSLISGLPSSAIKLFKTDKNGKFYVEENVDYQEAFFDIEDKVENKKIIICEDYAAKMIINKTLDRINKNQYFQVEYYHGGEKTLIKNYMPTISLNEVLSKKVFMIIDGDMNSGYKFYESELKNCELNNPDYLLECIKNAFGTEINAYIDGGNGDKREDQKCEVYLKYLNYYNTNIFYLPGIPEEIILKSKFVKEQYKSILDKYECINSKNAKEIICEISLYDYGNELHINDIIEKLSYKWSLEESDSRTDLISNLKIIFKK